MAIKTPSWLKDPRNEVSTPEYEWDYEGFKQDKANYKSDLTPPLLAPNDFRKQKNFQDYQDSFTSVAPPEKSSIWDKARNFNFDDTKLGKFLNNNPVYNFLDTLSIKTDNSLMPGSAPKQPKDLGTIGNKVTDIGGDLLSFAAPVPGLKGESLVSTASKLAKPLEEKFVNKLGTTSLENLPKLQQYGVNAVRSGAEFGGINALQSATNGDNLKDTLKSTGEGFATGALMGTLGKGLVDEVIPRVFPKLKPVNTALEPNLKQGDISTPLDKMKPVDNNLMPINNILQANKEAAPTKVISTKNRQFIENSIQNSEVAPNEMKATIQKSTYEPITNKSTWEKAQSRVNDDLQSSLNEFIKKNEVKTADDTALGEALINKAIQEGRIEDANALSINLAEKLTKAGQTVQAAAIFKRLSPEGMLQYANKTIQNANLKLPPNKKIKLSDDFAKKIVSDMQGISKMPEGQAKTEATQVVLKDIANQIPTNLLKKVDTLQTMAQLLNPKTSIRNVLGNFGMQVNENISNAIGTGLDKGISTITGKRTVDFPSIKTQLQGYKEGFQTGVRQTKLGIVGDNTQFDLPQGQVFQNKGIGKGLNHGQKVLDYMLRVPDEAAKTSIYNDSLRSQMKLAKVNVPTEEMKLMAENDAKYGTFQDDNAVSNAFSNIKKALNGNKEFGLGSMLLKYPKTPANILMRAIDYSPAGFFKATYRLAEPLLKGVEFNQRDFVKTTSRALVGTGNLIGAGYILNKLGIITGKSNADTDTANMQRQVGLGDYKLNLSALTRFVSSGFNPDSTKIQKGDKLVNYDWLQPSSIGLAIGANAADKNKNGTDILTTIVDSVNSGMNTLAQQPLISGLTTALGQKDITKGLTSTLKGVPASMIPTIFKQIAQLSDNTTRSSYDPNWVNQGVNMVKSKIPGLTTTLQPRLDSLGNEQKAFENNNPFNVFLNPAFNTTYNPKPAAQLPLDIFNNTGNVTAMPRQTPTYIIKDGKRINLTPQEATDFQRNVGQKTAEAIIKLGNAPANDDTAKKIQSIMTKIQTSERDKILNNRGISTDKKKKK